MSPREAFFADREAVPPERAAGRVSAETLSPYPPVRRRQNYCVARRCIAESQRRPLLLRVRTQGIPVAVPGAILSERAVAILRETLQARGLAVPTGLHPA